MLRSTLCSLISATFQNFIIFKKKYECVCRGNLKTRVHLVLVAQSKTFASSSPPESARVSAGHAIIKQDEREAANSGALAPCALPLQAARFAVVWWLSVAW